MKTTDFVVKKSAKIVEAQATAIEPIAPSHELSEFQVEDVEKRFNDLLDEDFDRAGKERSGELSWSTQGSSAMANKNHKYTLKDKRTGKVHSTYNNAPEAVRARIKIGGEGKYAIVKEGARVKEGAYNPATDLPPDHPQSAESVAKRQQQELQAKNRKPRGERATTDVKDGTQINELSPELRNRYLRKAIDQQGHAAFAARQSQRPGEKAEFAKTAERREKGISRALSNKRLGMNENNSGSESERKARLQAKIEKLHREHAATDDFPTARHEIQAKIDAVKAELRKLNTNEGTVRGFPNSWASQQSHSGKRVRMNHDDAHKIMTTDEYLELRDKLGPHDFDPNVGGEQGVVGIRYTGEANEGFSDTIKGIKRIIKGKPSPDEVRRKHFEKGMDAMVDRSPEEQKLWDRYHKIASVTDREPIMSEARADPTGSWIVYKGEDTLVKKFLTREGAKKYIAKHGDEYKLAAHETYYGKIKKKAVQESGPSIRRQSPRHTIEAYGVRGMDNKDWHKSFRDVTAMNKWAEANDATIIGTRDTEAYAHGRLAPAMSESASAGGSSAGGIATVVGGTGGKPGTGKPKKIGNKVKRTKPAIGKGIY